MQRNSLGLRVMRVCVPAVIAALLASKAFATSESVLSPDGRTAIHIDTDAGRFSISRAGELVIESSSLGLEFDGAPDLVGLALERRDDVAVDRTIAIVGGKAATARDHYNGATFAFRETQRAGRRLYIDVRVYDDGVAFRYRIDDPAPVRLRGERTTFVPAGDRGCLVALAREAHEMPFERLRISQMRTDVGYDVPVVCATRSGRTHFAISQAYLDGYTSASMWREGEALRVRLAAVPNRPGPAFVSKGGLSTSWRVVMMGDRAGDLIASHLIDNLNPPPSGDFSWVKSGKAAWD